MKQNGSKAEALKMSRGGQLSTVRSVQQALKIMFRHVQGCTKEHAQTFKLQQWKYVVISSIIFVFQ